MNIVVCYTDIRHKSHFPDKRIEVAKSIKYSIILKLPGLFMAAESEGSDADEVCLFLLPQRTCNWKCIIKKHVLDIEIERRIEKKKTC